ncbi:MAG: DUF294 nucleotidyltransferase-like domain-containing protein [Planctomycetota bacterium]
MTTPPPASAPFPRPHGRHFALNIVSPAILTFGLFLVFIFAIILPTMRKTILDRKREMIRELTQAAWSELAALQAQESAGALSRSAAQQAAVTRIQNMRYGDDGKDYFWISDMQPRMVMHPYRPELNGQDLSEYSDPAGKKLFVEFTRVVRSAGDGYVEYLWQWKDDESRVVPKLSYVKGFAPWGWIIGTGIYVEDVRSEINRMIRRVLLVSAVIGMVIAALLAYIATQGLNLERRRWQAETALRGSEEKYRSLVEGTTDGILLVLQDRPVYANKTLLQDLGYTETELPQVPLDRIIAPASGGLATAPGPEQRARLIARSGESADVLVTAAPVTIADKTGQILSIKTVAARRRTEETLTRLLAELQSMLPLTTRPIKSTTLSLVTCGLDTPVSEAAAAMTRAKIGAILITSPTGDPVGIVTDRDLRSRVLAAGVSPEQPVSTVMSAPLVRIADHALLFEAALVMQEHAITHLVVTDERGAAVGILTGTEVLHAQRHAMGLLLAGIREAPSPGALKDSRARLPVFVKALLESGARVEHITRIMATVSDAILVRAIALAEKELGPPPAAYCFVVLGSEAREEQTLATDQDNAIIYADVPPERNTEVHAYFLKLGETVCGWLDTIGYRRCKGDAMASNPKWCQPLGRWRQYFTDCVTAANPQDLLDVNIFLDFRAAYGEAGYVAELRRHLHDLLAGENRNVFFFHLAQSTLQFKPPRGFFGNIQVGPSGDLPSAFNIKTAIIPLVNFARMYTLRNRLAETNTLERLRHLQRLEVLLPSSHDELAQAYTVLMQMRLTHQAALLGRGAEPDNLIDLGELTQLERSVLKKVFADITVFQARLKTDFARTE